MKGEEQALVQWDIQGNVNRFLSSSTKSASKPYRKFTKWHLNVSKAMKRTKKNPVNDEERLKYKSGSKILYL